LSETALHFGKYQLLDRIAAGGMAEIFKARYSPAPGVVKQVVIKKILPHYAENKAFIAMFTNEARIAMGLSHGNIAQVFDFGAIDGDYFLAMELVDGQPLSKVLKRARAMGMSALPPEFAAFIASEMLRGLHYAHTRLDEQGRALQIVHRDVSPQNVLISYEAQVKLVDFGIARARNAGVEETNVNAAGVKGKYAYFAPEQARGKDLDARTDVFAAGIVLYEMLTGQLPFQGRMVDVLSRIVRGQFPRPREVNRQVPVELERIVLKAMALDRGERYPTAEAFHQELSKYLAQAHP
jgi:eukaryotic-like serine/threonine-protein kinase